MKRLPAPEFAEFLEFFPPLELPFSLLPDISQIQTDIQPLPGTLLDAYIFPIEGDEVDEYTEYIPYGKIEDTRDYFTLIYWKAGVMQYEYILATFTPEGRPISHAIIGGIRQDDSGMLHSVAVMNEDYSITIAEGIAAGKSLTKQPLMDTQTYRMNLDPTGAIQYETQDEEES